MNKFNYHCCLRFGTISYAENELCLEAVKNFLKSFHCNSYEIEDLGGFYEIEIKYESIYKQKVLRFSEALIYFSLFHRIQIIE